jgi:hypothetical protein
MNTQQHNRVKRNGLIKREKGQNPGSTNDSIHMKELTIDLDGQQVWHDDGI